MGNDPFVVFPAGCWLWGYTQPLQRFSSHLVKLPDGPYIFLWRSFTHTIVLRGSCMWSAPSYLSVPEPLFHPLHGQHDFKLEEAHFGAVTQCCWPWGTKNSSSAVKSWCATLHSLVSEEAVPWTSHSISNKELQKRRSISVEKLTVKLKVLKFVKND